MKHPHRSGAAIRYSKKSISFRSDRQKLVNKSSLSFWLLGNGNWDFFHGIPKGFSLRTRVRVKLESSTAGNRWDLFQTLMSLIACAIFVAHAYHEDFQYTPLDLTFATFFGMDYLLRFYCTDNRLVSNSCGELNEKLTILFLCVD